MSFKLQSVEYALSARKVAIVSGRPIYANRLEQLLGCGPHGLTIGIRHSRVPKPGEEDYDPDLLVLAPWDLEEMAGWLPALHRVATAIPWLLVADRRVAGMFMYVLDGRSCVVVPCYGGPGDRQAAVRELAHGGYLHAGHRTTGWTSRCSGAISSCKRALDRYTTNRSSTVITCSRLVLQQHLELV